MARIAFVSRLISADSGGGLGAYIAAQAKTLAGAHDVVVVTDQDLLELAESVFADTPQIELVHAGRFPEGNERGNYYSEMHKWSAQVLEALREHYGENGPDLIEFGDFHGEGAVTMQAAQTGEVFLRDTVICVRIHTSAEICTVLNGSTPDDFDANVLFSLERLALRDADRLLHAGGDIAATMQRFYGADKLPEFSCVRHASRFATARSEPPPRGQDDPLRLLYLGRMEHRKGVHNLVRAVANVSVPVQLTMVGGDTDSGPLGTSMLDNLHRGVLGANIELIDAVPHEELARLVDAHDAVIVPSLWECWPNTALEALARNRPVLATKVGGLAEIVEDGASGMLQRGTDFRSLVVLLERAYAAREQLAAWTAEGLPLAQFERLTDPQPIIAGYEEVIASGTRRRALQTGWRPRRTPLVSVVIPYFKMADYVEQTIESVRRQSYPNIEIVIANDGSAAPDDELLARYIDDPAVKVVTQLNSGLGAARNFGIANSRGRYFLPLDADDTIEPDYVMQAVTLLEADPELAYVGCWNKYFTDEDPAGDPAVGYQPLGPGLSINRFGNAAGHSGAVFRRRVFDDGLIYSEELSSFEDWEYYEALERRGERGVVMPRRMYNYRVRGDSMLRTVAENRHKFLEAEKRANLLYRSMEWVPQNG